MFGLDAFQTYLAIINVIAFVLFTIDYKVCLRRGDSLFHPFFLDFFALIGGPLGMLIAFLVWDRKVVKDNAWWRILALILLVVWILIVYCVYSNDAFSFSRLIANVGGGHTVLIAYLIVINVVTLVAFLMDKLKAVEHKCRTREFTLLMLAFIGGALGGLIGMKLARHKINSNTFKFSMPVMLVLNIVVIAFLVQAGIC